MKNIKTFCIHIGYPKTASTTIQNGLNINNIKLMNSDFYIPKSGIRGDVSAHHNLAFEIAKNPLFNLSAGSLKTFFREIRKVKQTKIIISSEYFSEFNDIQIKNALDIFGTLGKIRIIVYVRRQDIWLESYWKQAIKTGWTYLDFLSFVKEKIKYFGYYYDDIEKWAKLLGKENIFVRVFESAQLKGNVFRDFLTVCEVSEDEDIQLPESVNVSPSIKTVELIRYYLVKFGLFKQDFSKLSGRITQAILLFAQKEGWDNQKQTILTKNLSEYIMRHYEESNLMLANEYLNKSRLFIEATNNLETESFNIIDSPNQEILELTNHIIKYVYNKM